MLARFQAMKTIQVRVKPNARVSELEQGADDIWIARVKAPPVDGKANEELIVLIARHFEVRKGAVSIKSGAGGRLKLVQIAD
jgi:uncharacterized protein (TIGR00251 family)